MRSSGGWKSTFLWKLKIVFTTKKSYETNQRKRDLTNSFHSHQRNKPKTEQTPSVGTHLCCIPPLQVVAKALKDGRADPLVKDPRGFRHLTAEVNTPNQCSFSPDVFYGFWSRVKSELLVIF